MKGAIMDLWSVILSPDTACILSVTVFGTKPRWALRYPIGPRAISLIFWNKAQRNAWPVSSSFAFFLCLMRAPRQFFRSADSAGENSPYHLPVWFDSICLHSVVWKVGRTKSSTMLLPANKNTISLPGFKACWPMQCGNVHQVTQYVFESWNMHTHTHTCTCCDIFLFEVSRPTVHCNWFMLTGNLGISQLWMKSAYTWTDRIPTTPKGCTHARTQAC